jgi:SAM-dependent methyltransferase
LGTLKMARERAYATLANDKPGRHLASANRTRGVLPPFIDLASEYDAWFDKEGRGEQRLFDEESFGTVFLIATLCFLDSPRSVLRETNRILMPGGKVVLGVVLKESPWGQLYEHKRARGHRFYRYATFYSFDEVARLLAQTGFAMERVVSTLFEKPESVHHLEKHVEKPEEGYSADAGFTVMVAGKKSVQKKRRRQVM